jgi:predicted metal-dependent phosphoesterase TrpH
MGLADLHLHTTASDGMMSAAMVLNYVSLATPLDTLAITDHNTMDGYERAREFQSRYEHLQDITLIPAIEVSSRAGHIIGLWVERVIPRDLSAEETIAAIHEQGGLALAAHPFAWLPGLAEFTGVARRFLDLPFDAVETRNSTPTELLNNHRTTRANRAHTQPLAECGGSDAHFLWAIGRTWTEYPGRGASALREAIATRRTEAKGLPWGPLDLLHYFRDRFRWTRFCRHHGVNLHDF